ncbi:MAG TPA: type II toxin-antitoxin system RelB/DinJ family antitoxin [Candidatus Ornithomonoglobus merdipullorum]|uniref:Type II toxin-antitoxin system RelB/DinJ family antitoxin n=1 Tax=Candidatus Ornithomonoglobus merdipullorum TaxID=2840895 RepID=A0A9D1MCL8_9FIRM|nr:type II toxin-antitoxin system RelB/DinJ family antitoxin [Candidatus Ornithomonoglobus merdipullorum]
MAKTANVFARVEPDIKEQAETILEQLGIPMSNAISIFLRQVVLQNGIPFDVKLPMRSVTDISGMTEDEFNMEIETGMNDVSAGRLVSAERVRDEMRKVYGI